MDNQNTNSTLLSINMYLIEYANYVKSIDYASITNTKAEYLNTITMTNLKLNSISQINELVDLRDNINKLLDKCLTDIKDKERLFKLSEYNRYQKPIGEMLKTIKLSNPKIFAEKETELHTISKIFDSKLDTENFIEQFSQKIADLQSNLSAKQAELSDLKNMKIYNDFNLDKAKIVDKAKKYRQDIKEFDEFVITIVPNSKLLQKIIYEAENSDLKASKNNFSVLNKAEFSDLKIQFENLIISSMSHIEKEVNHISTFINNFLGDISTSFNSKWISIPQRAIKDISHDDQILLEAELKSTNAEIDKLSKRYGEFLTRIYDNYPKYLTDKIFSNIRIKNYK